MLNFMLVELLLKLEIDFFELPGVECLLLLLLFFVSLNLQKDFVGALHFVPGHVWLVCFTFSSEAG